MSRVALLVNASDPEVARHTVKDAQGAGVFLNLTIQPVEVRAPSELERTFSAIARGRFSEWQLRLTACCTTSDDKSSASLCHIAYRRSTLVGARSKLACSCPADQISKPFAGALPFMSTRSSKEPTSRSACRATHQV